MHQNVFIKSLRLISFAMFLDYFVHNLPNDSIIIIFAVCLVEKKDHLFFCNITTDDHKSGISLNSIFEQKYSPNNTIMIVPNT